MKFINIHTHTSNQPNEWCLQNLHAHFELILPERNYSIGIHPWHIDTGSTQFETLSKFASCPNVLAIGECGLDKLCNTDFQLQEKIFIQQVGLANELGKPLIIHCVKAFTELFFILRKQQIKVPVIIHGFNKNIRLANELIQYGYYLSFGKAVFNTNMQEVIKSTPIHQLFFENEDAHLSMQSIYEKAAALLGMTINDLSLQVQQNTKKVLGICI